MSIERLTALVGRFRQQVATLLPSRELEHDQAALGREFERDQPALESADARELLESMLQARYLDVVALELRTRGHGHYTIGSSGHESNAVLGRLTFASDPSLVHYRSAALQLERSRHVANTDP